MNGKNIKNILFLFFSIFYANIAHAEAQTDTHIEVSVGHCIIIRYQKKELIAHPRQKFYLAELDTWVTASILKAGDKLFSKKLGQVSIDSVELVPIKDAKKHISFFRLRNFFLSGDSIIMSKSDVGWNSDTIPTASSWPEFIMTVLVHLTATALPYVLDWTMYRIMDWILSESDEKHDFDRENDEGVTSKKHVSGSTFYAPMVTPRPTEDPKPTGCPTPPLPAPTHTGGDQIPKIEPIVTIPTPVPESISKEPKPGCFPIPSLEELTPLVLTQEVIQERPTPQGGG